MLAEAMLAAAGGHRASEDAGTSPPSGAPTSPVLFLYNGNRIGVQWVNGDSTANTEIGNSTGALLEPSFAFAQVSPGVTQYQTETTDVCPYWWVRHKKNGQFSSWVRATDSFNRDSCDGGALL